MKEQAKHALALFGSTSPSYLVLQSLDRTNAYLSDGYREKLSSFLIQVMQWKKRILAHGYMLTGDEPLKLTIATKAYGYEGKEFADLLKKKDIVCEFADPDFVVLMLTPEVEEAGLRQIEDALYGIEKRAPIKTKPPTPWMPERVIPIRQAMLSPCEAVTVDASFGRVLATANVSCPPAVPILVCGEKIDAKARDAFRYYGIESCFAVIE
jgi:arginine/lysine/ornithine decarboxylase